MPDNSDESKTFVAYVRASIILGDLAESCQQGTITTKPFAELRNALLWWLKELPSTIKFIEPASEQNFNMRQVYMLFLSTVAILHRSVRGNKSPSTVELVTSSLIVALFKDFHTRNELRRLSAGFNFYPIVAAIPLLEAFQFQSLRDTIRSEMNVIEDSLQDLGTRWPSAHRSLNILERIEHALTANHPNNLQHPGLPNDSDLLLFENLDYTKCGIWGPLTELYSNSGREKASLPLEDATQQRADIPYMAIPSTGLHEQPSSIEEYDLNPSEAMAYDDLTHWLSDTTFDEDLFGGWMLNDDAFGPNFSF